MAIVLTLLLLIPLCAAAQQSSNPPAPIAPSGLPVAKEAKGVANPASRVTGVDELPLVDPGSETIFWDGKMWSMSDQRAMHARWEKFLNEPEDAVEEYRAYSNILAEIINVLSANSYGFKAGESNAQAFILLEKASRFGADGGLCQTISNQVVAAWRGTRNAAALAAANKALEDESKRVAWNMKVAMQGSSLSRPGGSDGLVGENKKATQFTDSIGYQKRLTEIDSQLKSNDIKGELITAKRKIQFQALIIQMFFQRRFQHAIIAVRFYNSVYGDGDNELQLGNDTKNLFNRSAGMSPTLFSIEGIARETMADVKKGTDAALYLIQNNELASGANRLLESFLPGEYSPAIRTLSRDIKRQVLAYEQKRLKLIAAVESKDYALIAELLPEIAKIARDFDDTKYRGLVETAKAQANFHMAKAQDAAMNGDRSLARAELEAAGEIWPRNPDLEKTGRDILAVSSGQGKALMELDALLKQGNDRAVYEQKEKFIAAVAFDPGKQDATKAAIERTAKVEASLAMADELVRSGNIALAWEKLDALHQTAKDSKLSEKYADISSKASEFGASIRKAQAAADRGNVGSAMAFYLRAQNLAPTAETPPAQLVRLSKQAMAQ